MTPTFDRFVAPARLRPALWRLLIGLVVVVLVMTLWVVVLFGGVWMYGGWALVDGLLPEMAGADTTRGTILLLATFVGMALGPVVAARWLHKRGVGTLFGPATRFWRDFAWGTGTIAAIVVVSLVVLAPFAPAPEPNLPPGLWLQLLIPALVLILIQTGAEEMLFRGYMMQQLAARFPTAWVYLILPAVIFGALHYDPVTGGENAWIIAAAAGVFGLIAGDLTRVTGSLGVAWGLHFANNVAAVMLISTKGTITGLALYLTPYSADDAGALQPLVLLDMAILLVVWAVLRRKLRP